MNEHHSQPIHTNQGALSVRKCACGGVHLCIGGVSINLTRDTALYLSDRLGEVCESIRREAATAPAEKDRSLIRLTFPGRN